MLREQIMAVGEIVLVLLALFLGLVTLALVLVAFPFGHTDEGRDLAQTVIEWAGGAFFALLGVLGVRRLDATSREAPPTGKDELK